MSLLINEKLVDCRNLWIECGKQFETWNQSQSTQFSYLNPKNTTDYCMLEYLAYFPAKVETVITENEITVAYIEFHDGNKALVSVLKPIKEGDMVLVGRRILVTNQMSNPPIFFKDEIISVLTEKNNKIYEEMKKPFDVIKEKQKEEKSYIG
jgi:hypothetical protein